MPVSSSAKRPACTRLARPLSSPSVSLARMPRRYFGPDGVRGIVGQGLTPQLVERLALDLGVVISASHNPPEYNGVKFFDRKGRKLTDAQEEEIEALLESPPRDEEGGRIDDLEVAVDSYLDHVLERFGTDLDGLRVGV